MIEVLSEVNYRIQKSGKKNTVVEHFDHLKPYRSEPPEIEVSEGELEDGNSQQNMEEEEQTPSMVPFKSKRTKRVPKRYGDLVFY